jgi:hypothetical protein
MHFGEDIDVRGAISDVSMLEGEEAGIDFLACINKPPGFASKLVDKVFTRPLKAFA